MKKVWECVSAPPQL